MMSPGSLSFAKLVMMLENLQRMPDTPTKIHSFNQRCLIQSRLQSVFFLIGMRAFYVERNKYISLTFSGRHLPNDQIRST